jgi:beta-phosphoglucomutase
MSASYAVIFDVDGVLVDSYQAHFASWRKMAQQQGWTITESEFAHSFGRTSREIIAERWSHELPSRATDSTGPALGNQQPHRGAGDQSQADRRRLAAGLSDHQIAELDDRKEAIYREILRESFPAMPGASQLITALADCGFALAVGSSGPPENVQLVLDHVDPDRRIRAVVTGADVTRGKPDPQVFQLAAQRLAVPPADCVVVEDAAPGLSAAHAAGMRCVGLVSTGRTAEQLQAADLIVDSLEQLTPETFRQLIGQPP